MLGKIAKVKMFVQEWTMHINNEFQSNFKAFTGGYHLAPKEALYTRINFEIRARTLKTLHRSVNGAILAKIARPIDASINGYLAS